MKILLFILFVTITHGFAAVDTVEDLYQRLKDDFESKPHFFNSSINDFRPEPLTLNQIAKLPDAEFLDKKPFFLAMAGRERLIKAGKIKNHRILAVVDFSRHSNNRRIFIMDILNGEVLVNTYTSHAYYTDSDQDGYADSFSNVSGSEKTSVGFMSSDVSYYGNYGYSLRLKGHDPKLNSNVLARAVVVHGFGGMDVTQASWGKISTSQGCLMFSTNESGRFWGMEDKSMLQIVIGLLKPGSLIFNYTEQDDLKLSEWIKSSDVPSGDHDKMKRTAVEYIQPTEQEESDHLGGPDILPADMN